MKRLTRKSDSGMVWFVDHENGAAELEACDMGYHNSRLAIEKLAEYEDLEEQGRLLKLPCAVGDTIYTLNTLQSGKTIIGKLEADEFFCALCTINGRFGKTAFLTHEEAEKARNQLN